MKPLLPIILFLYLMSCQAGWCQEINWDSLVEAVIEVESSGDPDAVSPQGCIGLMQINPNGALKEWNEYQTKICNGVPYGAKYRDFANDSLYYPIINKTIGTWYLKRLKNHYKCPTIEHILSAYNGGITRLRRNNWDIEKMPSETKSYVKKVMRIYNHVGNKVVVE